MGVRSPDQAVSDGPRPRQALSAMSSFEGTTTTANGSSSATEQAKEKAQRARSRPSASVRDQVDQRSTRPASGRLHGAATSAASAEELRKQGKDQPAKLAEQAAQRAESLGDYLKRTDGDTILRDVEDFGRQRPWAVIAGGLALGFAASRFLKASSSRRYESSPSTTRGLTAGPPTTRAPDGPGRRRRRSRPDRSRLCQPRAARRHEGRRKPGDRRGRGPPASDRGGPVHRK